MTIARAREVLKLSEAEANDEMVLKIVELTKQLVRLYLKSKLI